VGILTIAVLFVVAAGIAETGSIGLLSGNYELQLIRLGPNTTTQAFVCLCWARRVGAGQDNQRFRGAAAAHVAALLPVGLHQQHSADRYYDPWLVSASLRVLLLLCVSCV
jgi:hypothetical protein